MTNEEEDEEQDGALAALTILDLSEGIAGPYAAKLFADYGARVIKVERPGHGDPSREGSLPLAAGFIPQTSHTPENPTSGDALSDSDPPSPFTERGLGGEVSVSRVYLYVNTNKESLTLNYETEAGAAILHRLIEDADGLIEDYPSRRQADLGLDSDSLMTHVPRLVICRVSAFAPAGPRATESYDALGGDSAAFSTGLHAFTAMLAALWHASQSEHGQIIEVDALSSLASELGPSLTQALNGAQPAAPSVAPVDASAIETEDIEHPVAGIVATPLGPFELDATPWLAGRAPLLGEHTDQVLGEIGIDASEIETLRREGVV